MSAITLTGQTVTTTKVNLRQGAPNRSAAVLRKLEAGVAVPVRALVVGEAVQGNAHWYQTDDQAYIWAGACAPLAVGTSGATVAPSSSPDAPYVPRLIAMGSSQEGLVQARQRAAKALSDAGEPPFPKNACAGTLSGFLQLSGIAVPLTLGAGRLAHLLGGDGGRGWRHVAVGDQQAGDVGVCFDEGGVPGADHIYLVLRAIDRDEMFIADNQEAAQHARYASGKGGKTPTEYFLRAG